MKIGQSALQGVVMLGQHCGEGSQAGMENIYTARVAGSKGSMALDNVERGLLLRSGLGDYETSARKVKGRQIPFAPQIGSRLAPVKSSSDHQVDEEPELILETDGDALADTLQLEHPFVFHH
jgi:hypothetical protein